MVVAGRKKDPPLAAVLAGDFRQHGRRVGVILSGGNVELESLPWCRPAPEPKPG